MCACYEISHMITQSEFHVFPTKIDHALCLGTYSILNTTRDHLYRLLPQFTVGAVIQFAIIIELPPQMK